MDPFLFSWKCPIQGGKVSLDMPPCVGTQKIHLTMCNNNQAKTVIFWGGHFSDRWSLVGHTEGVPAATICKALRQLQSSMHQLLSTMMLPLIFIQKMIAGCYKPLSIGHRTSSFPAACLPRSPTISGQLLLLMAVGLAKGKQLYFPLTVVFKTPPLPHDFHSYGSPKAIKWRHERAAKHLRSSEKKA